MQNPNDVVLQAYGHLAGEVADYVNSQLGTFETLPASYMFDAVEALGNLYGADMDRVATAIREANDIPAKADELRGDPMVLARIVGTLSQNLADISACVYDVDTGLQVIECLGAMMGTVLIIQEFQDA